MRTPVGLSVSILGPLSLSVGDREVVISGARRRAVLIRLLLAAGSPLDPSRLLDDVWAGNAPAAAANSLQAHIGYLRRQLGPGRVLTDSRAYRLDMDGVSVDSVEFEHEVRAARLAMDGCGRERRWVWCSRRLPDGVTRRSSTSSTTRGARWRSPA